MTITVAAFTRHPFPPDVAPLCETCDQQHWSCRCPKPRPLTTDTPQPIVRVKIEDTPFWGNFKGCENCTGDRGHVAGEFAFGTCKCACHAIPSHGAVIELACGCTKHRGISTGRLEPQVGDLDRCWGMH